MKITHLTRKILAATLSLSFYLGAGGANAQERGFADDFTTDSIRFSSGSFDDSSGIYSVNPSSEGLLLSTRGRDANTNGTVFLDVEDSSDSIGMDLTHLPASSVGEGAYINAYVEAILYSDDPGTSDENRAGSVWADISVGYDQAREPVVFYCLGRENEFGDRIEVPDACGPLEGVSLAMGELTELRIALDRDTKEVVFSANDVSVSIDITGEIYSPQRQFKRLYLRTGGGEANAEALLHAVYLGDETVDMAVSPPVFDRYYTNFDTGSTVEIVNEKLAVTAVSSAEKDYWIDAALDLKQPTDYLEAELSLSSESDVSMVNHRLFAGVEGHFFNTEVDGGAEGLLGEVRAGIFLEAQGDGLRRVEICFQRYDDAEGDSRTGLLNPEDPDNRCDNLPFFFEFDTTYRVSLDLDRDSSSFTFRVNDFSRTIPLNTNIFRAAEPFSRVSIASRNGAIAIGTLDNIRSAADVLTATEIATGDTLPASFPELTDFSNLQVDSTVEYPFDFFNYEPRLDFVDDFSGITTDFGFWGGRDRGDSGVSWSDGSIKLETSSASDEDGNYTEFNLDPKTDLLEAVVSLSSESRFVPGNTGAEISIRTIFYNDTQNYGFNDEEGDMEASLILRHEGDGRRSVRVQLRRRDSDGNGGDNLLDDIVEFEEGLRALVPDLDRAYKLSLAIDRISGVIRYGVDDQFTDYQIPTEVFLPSRRRALISVNHFRGSGVAVGRIHSVRTDTIDQDFSSGAPVLAPYRPTFNAQHAGRIVEVIDGRLRLEADGTLSSGRDPRITALSGSDYVGATIELSSESVVVPDGRVLVGVSGSMYNDLPGGVIADGNHEGHVFAAVRITADGSGDRFVQYCAFRSNNSDFSDETELVGGDPNNCPRFVTVPDLDVAYPAFIKLDRTASTLTFGFNGETVVHDISTPINTMRPFHGVRARTTDGSKVVAWADDLSFAENPVALADSVSALVVDASVSSTEGVDGVLQQNNDSDTGGGGVFTPVQLIWALLIVALSKIIRIATYGSFSPKQFVRTSIFLSSAMLLHGCATTSLSEAPPKLNKGEVLAHISGKTETWSAGAGYYAPNGNLSVLWNSEDSYGTWYVTDSGDVCFDVDIWGPDEACHSYSLIDGAIQLVFNDKPVFREVFDGDQLDLFR